MLQKNSDISFPYSKIIQNMNDISFLYCFIAFFAIILFSAKIDGCRWFCNWAGRDNGETYSITHPKESVTIIHKPQEAPQMMQMAAGWGQLNTMCTEMRPIDEIGKKW